MRPATRCTALFVACGLLFSPALAGPLPDRFTLGRYIPDDVWFYVHAVHNPERAWLDAEWAEVWHALKESGIDRDVISLVMSLLGDEDRAKVEALVKALENVRWCDLVAKEFALGERMARDFPERPLKLPYEYFFLMRGEAGTTEANMAALVVVLKQIASWTDKIRLSESDVRGVTVWSLGSSRPNPKKYEPQIDLFRKGDIVGIAIGIHATKDVTRLMTGKAERSPVVALPRFKAALAEVKPPEDSLMFFNANSLFAGIDRLMKRAATGPPTNHDDEDLKIISTIRKALDLFNLWDYSLMTTETEGLRELTHTVARLQEDKRDSPLVRVFFEREPFGRFDEFVPVDATGFSLSGLFDLEKLYQVLVDFVEEEVPDGAKHIARWNELLASIGFDPQRDLFSWWSGEMVSITLPPTGVTPMGNPDSVLMFRVKNSELASRKISAGLDALCCKFHLAGQPLIVTPAPIDAEGFRQVSHPLLMMLMRPIIGVKDGWLMIGSSGTAIEKCLDVAAGKAPSIVESERFKREGLMPKGRVSSVSFKDLSQSSREARTILALTGSLALGLATALPDEPKTREIKMVLTKLTPILMKLGPVLEKIDFYSSRSGVTTYDGALTLRTENVTTYKPPPTEASTKTAAPAK